MYIDDIIEAERERERDTVLGLSAGELLALLEERACLRLQSPRLRRDRIVLVRRLGLALRGCNDRYRGR
jgi:hypothetical protein